MFYLVIRRLRFEGGLSCVSLLEAWRDGCSVVSLCGRETIWYRLLVVDYMLFVCMSQFQRTGSRLDWMQFRLMRQYPARRRSSPGSRLSITPRWLRQ